MLPGILSDGIPSVHDRFVYLLLGFALLYPTYEIGDRSKITEIKIPANITEGDEVTLKAIANQRKKWLFRLYFLGLIL